MLQDVLTHHVGRQDLLKGFAGVITRNSEFLTNRRAHLKTVNLRNIQARFVAFITTLNAMNV